MRGRWWRHDWGIELILFYGLALLFFTALPSLPLDRASLSLFSAPPSSPRFTPSVLFIYQLSHVACPIPVQRTSRVSSSGLNRLLYTSFSVFPFSVSLFRPPFSVPPLVVPASSSISFSRRRTVKGGSFTATRGIGTRQLHRENEKTYWDSLRTTVLRGVHGRSSNDQS